MNLHKFKISRRPNIIEGVKVKETENLLLFINNPVDFVLDGIGIINKHYLKKEEAIESQIRNQIINLKLKTLENNFLFPLNTFSELFNYFNQNDSLIHLEFESDDYCLIGKVVSNTDEYFLFKELSPNGDFIEEEKIKYSKIRNIYLSSDYLNSFELYLNK